MQRRQQRLHLLRRKSKDLAISAAQHRINIEIIQAAENTLFRYAQDPRKDGKIQIIIGFQDTAQELFHKSDAVFVKTAFPGLLNRGIVFIHKDDDFLSIILAHHEQQ